LEHQLGSKRFGVLVAELLLLSHGLLVLGSQMLAEGLYDYRLVEGNNLFCSYRRLLQLQAVVAATGGCFVLPPCNVHVMEGLMLQQV